MRDVQQVRIGSLDNWLVTLAIRQPARAGAWRPGVARQFHTAKIGGEQLGCNGKRGHAALTCIRACRAGPEC